MISAVTTRRAVLAARTCLTASARQQRRNYRKDIHDPPEYKTFLSQKPLGPGEKRQRQGWEWIYFGGFGGGLLTLIIGLNFKPDTRIENWARDEALVRELLEAEGEELEVGRYYSQEKHGHVFTKAEIGVVPIRGIQ